MIFVVANSLDPHQVRLSNKTYWHSENVTESAWYYCLTFILCTIKAADVKKCGQRNPYNDQLKTSKIGSTLNQLLWINTKQRSNFYCFKESNKTCKVTNSHWTSGETPLIIHVIRSIVHFNWCSIPNQDKILLCFSLEVSGICTGIFLDLIWGQISVPSPIQKWAKSSQNAVYHSQILSSTFWCNFHAIRTLRERSGSVVECLTRDRRAAGSSLTGVTALCPWARHIYPSLVLVQPRKTRPA